jgi:hypothetical protein
MIYGEATNIAAFGGEFLLDKNVAWTNPKMELFLF